MTTALLIIDPQNDFMDSPNFKGALAVPGGYADMVRLAKHIDDTNPTQIFLTIDSHNEYDIAHKLWWIDEAGNHPNNYTTISIDDVESGKWKPVDTDKQDYALMYVRELAKKNKYKLIIWPNHCIEGTKGHDVEDTLAKSLAAWEVKNDKKVEYIYKGRNPNTEHYSGFKAEVPLTDDEDTQLNIKAIASMDKYDVIQVAGEASSHCVAGTSLDLIENLPSQIRHKVVLLTNCMSAVPGFENDASQFLTTAFNMGAISLDVKDYSKKLKMV